MTNTYAESNIFVSKYEKIKNYDNIIVVMPDKQNRNIKGSCVAKAAVEVVWTHHHPGLPGSGCSVIQ